MPTLEEEMQAQRRHDKDMAELANQERQDSREFRGKVLAGLAALVFVLSIVISVAIGIQHSDTNRLRIEQEHTKVEQEHANVAKYCMDKGNIWINNSCIPKDQTQK